MTGAMPPTGDHSAHIFTAHPLYRGLTLAAAVTAGFALWQMRGQWDILTLLLLLAGVVLTVYFGRLALARITLDARHVHLAMLGARPRRVEYRQLSAVHEEGRGIRSILLLYHPRMDNGLVDTSELHSLNLPATAHGDALLAALTERTPR